MADDNTMSGGSQFGGRYNAPSTFLGSSTSSAPSRSSRGSAGRDGDGAGTGGGGTDGKGDAVQDTPGGEGDARSPDGGSEDSKGWSASGRSSESGASKKHNNKGYDWSYVKKAKLTTLSPMWDKDKGILDATTGIPTYDWPALTESVRASSSVTTYDMGFGTYDKNPENGSDKGIEWGSYNTDSIRYTVLQLLSIHDPYKFNGKSVFQKSVGGLRIKKGFGEGAMEGGQYMWPFHQSKALNEFLGYFKNKFYAGGKGGGASSKALSDDDWVRTGSVAPISSWQWYWDHHANKTRDDGSRNDRTAPASERGTSVMWTGILPVGRPVFLPPNGNNRTPYTGSQILWTSWKRDNNHWAGGPTDVDQYPYSFPPENHRVVSSKRKEFAEKDGNWVFFQYLKSSGLWHLPWDYDRLRRVAKSRVADIDTGDIISHFEGWYFWKDNWSDAPSAPKLKWGNLFADSQLSIYGLTSPSMGATNWNRPFLMPRGFEFIVEGDAFNMRGLLSDGKSSDTLQVSGYPALRPGHERGGVPRSIGNMVNKSSVPKIEDEKSRYIGASYDETAMGTWNTSQISDSDSSAITSAVELATDGTNKEQLFLLSISAFIGSWDDFDEIYGDKNFPKPSEAPVRASIYSPYDGFGGNSDIKRGDPIMTNPAFNFSKDQKGPPQVRHIWNTPHDFFVLGPYGSEWVGPTEEKMYFCASKKEMYPDLPTVKDFY